MSGKLSDEEIKIVKEHIIKGHDKYYLLYAAVVMNNHAHVIFQPVEKYTLS
ncbi:MAG: hypothetical protein K8I03_11310 [Ignavibacteria bacterium]|nr:hypothetical protein [Ignavibacteria bacterium]